MAKFKSILIVLFLSCAYFPLFHKLDQWSLRKWDEARNAVGAINMMASGDYLVREYAHQMDTWETKPPMFLWWQIISIKALGLNMWAIRMPSAVSALLLMLAMLFFYGKVLNDWLGGFIAAFALLVSDGFMKAHVARTGDHDALLSFFLVISVLYFYKFLKTNALSNILKAAFFTFCATLTKSVMGLLFLPGILVYLVLSRQFLDLFKKPTVYWGLLGLFLGIGGYYAMAEWTHPGYLQAVWKMELLPRFQNADGKYLKPERWHYLNLLVKQQRFPFWYLLPFCLWATWKSEKKAPFMQLLWSVALSFSLIMSFGVWYDWYDAPLYPLWAMIFGGGLSEIIQKTTLLGFEKQPNPLKFMGLLLAILLLFSKPYYNTAKRVSDNHAYQKPNEQYGEFIENRLRNQQDCNFSMLYSNIDPYDAPMQFYQKKLTLEKQHLNLIYIDLNRNHLSHRDSIEVGQRYLCCHPELVDSLQKYYSISKLEQNGDCTFFQILQ
jgi:4-amino-4-deoxy-L-arabinose transferase-like glycosyltransferase